LVSFPQEKQKICFSPLFSVVGREKVALPSFLCWQLGMRQATQIRLHSHICGPVPDLQPHHPTGKWVEGQQLFFGLHHRDEVR
jgi:hypothetical protein